MSKRNGQNFLNIIWNVLFLVGIEIIIVNKAQSEDGILQKYLTMPEMVRGEGYPLENHYVTTQDGYILLVHRIPRTPKEAVYGFNVNKPVILLAHGAMASSGQWVIGNASNSLGYYLCDNGFDVWMLNFRGNRYSRNHTTLNPDEQPFWNFSFDEIGQYDLPAVIDYILAATGRNKLNYLGHSMGTTTFFVCMSLNPSYNKKIVHMIAWSPVAFVGHYDRPLIKYLSKRISEVGAYYQMFHGTMEMFAADSFFAKTYRYMCTRFTEQWLGLTGSALGRFYLHFNEPMKYRLVAEFPVGSSAKVMMHYGQLIDSGYFRRYDEGIEGNKVRYGQSTPPNYNLSLVNAPITLFEAKNDYFCNAQDLDSLEKALANMVERYVIERESFSHLSYVAETDTMEQVLIPTINRLIKYNNMNKS